MKKKLPKDTIYINSYSRNLQNDIKPQLAKPQILKRAELCDDLLLRPMSCLHYSSTGVQVLSFQP